MNASKILETDIDKLVPCEFDCPCGRRHSINIQSITIGSGVSEQVAEIARPFEYGRLLLVADTNTYRVLGARIENILKENGYDLKCFIYNTPDAPLTPDERALGRLFLEIGPDITAIIAVGSGTINDLARVPAFMMKIPYIIVGTAPSMDGYTSVLSPIIVDGSKISIYAEPPYAVIADTDIMKNAPEVMLQAGFGDIAGKITSIADWKLASLIKNDYYCDLIASMMKKVYKKLMDNALVFPKGKHSVEIMTGALMLPGIAMTFAGTSQPASGTEHHLAHYWEDVAISHGERHPLHGNSVGVGTVIAASIYEILTEMGMIRRKSVSRLRKP